MAKTQKAYKGPAMEGMIANWYARNTRDDGRWQAAAAALTASLLRGARVLEVAPGPGYLAMALARRGDLVVSGLDISASFVRMARDNALLAGLSVDFREGNAAAMPFADASFDCIVCQAAFKNFSDPLGALDEMYRVLAPGGHATIHDLRKDASLPDVDAEIARMNLSRVNGMWTRFVFRSFLLKNAYTEEALLRLVAQSRFARGELSREGISFELRLTRPSLAT